MNKINSASKIKLNSFNDLFGMNDSMRETGEIREVLIDDLYDFHDHPFKPISKEKMDELVKSVSENGVLTPGVARIRPQGGYEIIAGHNRREACWRAGISTMPMFIRNLSDEEAIIAMVESNYQRSEILPSEKAHAYKMMFEAMKRQGERTDLTSSPPGTKPRTTETMSQIVGDSRSQIDRYIRLTELIPELLDMVDSCKISLRPAYELSFLSKDEQRALFDAIEYIGATPSHAQAIRMKECSRTGSLKMSTIGEIMNEEKPNQADRISVRFSDVRRYIPESVPFDKTAEYIMKALEVYSQYLESERQKSKTHSSREAR